MTNYMANIDPSQPLLPQLVGEGRPFSDLEALAKSKFEGNKTIESREVELSRLRDELDTALTYEEFLTRADALNRRSEEPRLPDNQPEKPTPKTTETANMTLQDVERIVELREQKKTLENNRNSVLSQYAEANGPNHAIKLEQQATELGYTKEGLLNLAATNPKAFYRLVGLEGTHKQEQFMSPPKTQMNMDVFVPSGGSKKNFEYYETLRKTDKALYWQPRVQNEMLKQLTDLGDAFYA